MATARGGSGPDPGSRGLLLLSFSVVLAGEVTPPGPLIFKRNRPEQLVASASVALLVPIAPLSPAL